MQTFTNKIKLKLKFLWSRPILNFFLKNKKIITNMFLIPYCFFNKTVLLQEKMMTLWDISVEEDVRKLIFNPTKYMQNITLFDKL